MNVLSVVPGSVLVPVNVTTTPSPSANPSPVTSYSGLVNGVPLYSLCASWDTRVIFLGLIFRVPPSTCTANWSDTSLPSASLTIGVPVTIIGYSPACMPDTDVSSPSTVYVCPLTSKVVSLKPSSVCSLPSYSVSSSFVEMVISNCASRLTIVNVPNVV